MVLKYREAIFLIVSIISQLPKTLFFFLQKIGKISEGLTTKGNGDAIESMVKISHPFGRIGKLFTKLFNLKSVGKSDKNVVVK